jgi:hypothetical protein
VPANGLLGWQESASYTFRVRRVGGDGKIKEVGR